MTSRPTAIRRTAKRIIDITNGKIMRLLVDDEPFDVRYGEWLGARAGARPAGRTPMER